MIAAFEVLLIIWGFFVIVGVGFYYFKSSSRNNKFEESLYKISVPTYHLSYNSINHKFVFYGKSQGKSDSITLEDFESNIHSNDIDNWRRWFATARNKCSFNLY